VNGPSTFPVVGGEVRQARAPLGGGRGLESKFAQLDLRVLLGALERKTDRRKGNERTFFRNS